MIRTLSVVLMLIATVFFSGCEDDAAVVKPVTVAPKVKTISPPKQVKIQDNTDDKSENSYRYIAEGRRDPFTSLLKIREPLNEDAEPETPLQKFGIKELRLIATILGKDEPKAMVVAPDKKAYTLLLGVKIGRNRGQVVRIDSDKVVVEERFRDFSGSLRTELREISLPQGEGE